jgi:hypothetical protein
MPVGGTIYRLVMDANDLTVFRQVNIDIEKVAAADGVGIVKRCHRIRRCQQLSTLVCQHQRPW